jgi:hypothetical protein
MSAVWNTDMFINIGTTGINQDIPICFNWIKRGKWNDFIVFWFHLGVSNVGRNELKQRLMGSNPSHYVDVVPCK